MLVVWTHLAGFNLLEHTPEDALPPNPPLLYSWWFFYAFDNAAMQWGCLMAGRWRGSFGHLTFTAADLEVGILAEVSLILFITAQVFLKYKKAFATRSLMGNYLYDKIWHLTIREHFMFCSHNRQVGQALKFCPVIKHALSIQPRFASSTYLIELSQHLWVHLLQSSVLSQYYMYILTIHKNRPKQTS